VHTRSGEHSGRERPICSPNTGHFNRAGLAGHPPVRGALGAPTGLGASRSGFRKRDDQASCSQHDWVAPGAERGVVSHDAPLRTVLRAGHPPCGDRSACSTTPKVGGTCVCDRRRAFRVLRSRALPPQRPGHVMVGRTVGVVAKRRGVSYDVRRARGPRTFASPLGAAGHWPAPRGRCAWRRGACPPRSPRG
jgi:hypothetical protein